MRLQYFWGSKISGILKACAEIMRFFDYTSLCSYWRCRLLGCNFSKVTLCCWCFPGKSIQMFWTASPVEPLYGTAFDLCQILEAAWKLLALMLILLILLIGLISWLVNIINRYRHISWCYVQDHVASIVWWYCLCN